jgi:hypothetical protein
MCQTKLFAEQYELQSPGWLVGWDFRVTGLLLDLQVGYIKMPCFLCEWDSRSMTERWERHEWPPKKIFVSGVEKINTEATGR